MLVTSWKKWQERNLHRNHFRWFQLPLMPTDSWNHRLKHTGLASSNAELKVCNGTRWQTITSHREATYKPLICEAALIQMQTYDSQKNSEAPVQKSSQITSFYHVEVKTKVFETTVYGFVYLFFLHCSNLSETSIPCHPGIVSTYPHRLTCPLLDASPKGFNKAFLFFMAFLFPVFFWWGGGGLLNIYLSVFTPLI